MKEIIKEDIGKIRALLKSVVGADGWTELERLGGLTNHTYHVTLADGREYAVRIPGEGTEEMIVRSDEQVSTRLACGLGIDAQLLYFGDDGSKVTEYIPEAVTMSPALLKNDTRIRAVAEIFRKLHGCGKDTGVPFEVFRMAALYEKIIHDQKVPMFADYAEQKAKVMAVKEIIDR